MKSPMDDHKHSNLATLAMHVLSVLTSNANSDGVFSLVWRVKTEFRSTLRPETVTPQLNFTLTLQIFAVNNLFLVQVHGKS